MTVLGLRLGLGLVGVTVGAHAVRVSVGVPRGVLGVIVDNAHVVHYDEPADVIWIRVRKAVTELAVEPPAPTAAAAPSSEPAGPTAHERLETLETDAEKLAFYINLYNVLSMHGVIARGVERSVMEIPSFFRTTAYRVGKYVLTLDDIESGILRRNSPPVGARARRALGAPHAALVPRRADGDDAPVGRV